MKKMHVIILLSFLVFNLLITPVLADEISSEEGIPEEVLQVAEAGLAKYRQVAKTDLTRWGLTSVEEADRASLGDGYEVVYLGQDTLSARTDASLLSLEDKSLFSTWIFILELDHRAKTLMIICREAGQSYQCSGFGGDATYFADAVKAFHQFAGTEAKPILLRNGPQDFLLTNQNGKEYVVPVPYDQASDDRVASGKGVIESSQLITAIQNAYQEYMEKNVDGKLTFGVSYIDVWQTGSAHHAAPAAQAAAMAGSIILVSSCGAIMIRRKSMKQRTN